jgi:hypothetical protein
VTASALVGRHRPGPTGHGGAEFTRASRGSWCRSFDRSRVRRDLVIREELDGALGYADRRSILDSPERLTLIPFLATAARMIDAITSGSRSPNLLGSGSDDRTRSALRRRRETEGKRELAPSSTDTSPRVQTRPNAGRAGPHRVEAFCAARGLGVQRPRRKVVGHSGIRARRHAVRGGALMKLSRRRFVVGALGSQRRCVQARRSASLFPCESTGPSPRLSCSLDVPKNSSLISH